MSCFKASFSDYAGMPRHLTAFALLQQASKLLHFVRPHLILPMAYISSLFSDAKPQTCEFVEECPLDRPRLPHQDTYTQLG